MSRKISTNAQVFDGDLFESSTTAKHSLGARAVSDNGEVFRYVKAGGTALVAGTLLQGPANVANHTDIAVAAAAAVGDTTITVTLGATAATADQYAGGLVVVNDVDGQGFTYRVKSHPAAGSAASLVITLEDPIREALTTSSEVTLLADVYNGVIINPTTASGSVVGVAITDTPADNYGWVQTWGVTSLLNQGGTAIGLGIARSGSVAGAGATVAATTTQIGYATVAGVDTEYSPAFITISA